MLQLYFRMYVPSTLCSNLPTSDTIITAAFSMLATILDRGIFSNEGIVVDSVQGGKGLYTCQTCPGPSRSS